MRAGQVLNASKACLCICDFTPMGAFMSTKKEMMILVLKTVIRCLIGAVIAFFVFKVLSAKGVI
jgi:hypothetical protein